MKKMINVFIYLLAVIWFIPLIWLVITTFKTNNTEFSLHFSFTLNNLSGVLKAAPFRTYYINTLLIVVIIFFIQVITTTLAAYAFAKLEFRGKNIIFAMVLIQLMVPNDVLMFTNYNTLADFRLVDTKMGIMLPFFASALGIFLLRQTFKTIPYELEEAASIDGCNFLQILWHIYVPLAKPTYTAFGLVSISYHWNDFLWPLIVTSSEKNRTITVGLALFAKANESNLQWAQICAATFLVIFPLILIFFLFQKQFISSFIQSGIK